MTLIRKLAGVGILALPTSAVMAHVGSHQDIALSHFIGEPVHNGLWVFAGCVVLSLLCWKRWRRY